jgi:glycosyltransferase involved in cell wall biosynthesis
MLRELFSCANLFVFPTREESFGLVVPEAALSGAKLLVLNKSLLNQIEISGFTCLYFDFGAFNNNFQPEDPDEYYRAVASIILDRMRYQEAITSATYFRLRNNWNFLYHQFYKPIMEGSAVW